MKNLLYPLLFISLSSFSQENREEITYTYNTFNSTRIINSHSVEMMEKKTADFRIGHRFGDIAGDNGGIKTLFGIDNSSDIAVGLEYGITNNLNVGITRYKGAGPYLQLYEGYAKYKVLAQSNEMPISLVGLAKLNVTSMSASPNNSSPTSFPDFVSRTSASYQLLIGRKFSERLSLQIMPTYVHRNYVGFNDQNGTFAIGAGGRIQLSKLVGIIGEYHYVFFNDGVQQARNTFNPIALGFEFDTGGHIFQLNFSNSRGFGEAQYIPTTFSDFTEGQFRFGFSISRVFKL